MCVGGGGGGVYNKKKKSCKFLFSPQNIMLWVLIKSTLWHFQCVPTMYVLVEKYEKYSPDTPSYLDLCHEFTTC